MLCKMARFYGYTYDELINLDTDIYMMFIQGMNEVENEELLLGFTKSWFPNMQADQRSKLHKNTHKLSYPRYYSEPKNVVKLSDLGKVLNGR